MHKPLLWRLYGWITDNFTAEGESDNGRVVKSFRQRWLITAGFSTDYVVEHYWLRLGPIYCWWEIVEFPTEDDPGKGASWWSCGTWRDKIHLKSKCRLFTFTKGDW